ncbi:MAG: hypothetical protein WC441_05250 [Patescibacteria group bacterium]
MVSIVSDNYYSASCSGRHDPSLAANNPSNSKNLHVPAQNLCSCTTLVLCIYHSNFNWFAASGNHNCYDIMYPRQSVFKSLFSVVKRKIPFLGGE